MIKTLILRHFDQTCETILEINSFNYVNEIDNEIYLYEMLTTNLLQTMLDRRVEQSHQHQQSSNSALLMH